MIVPHGIAAATPGGPNRLTRKRSSATGSMGSKGDGPTQSPRIGLRGFQSTQQLSCVTGVFTGKGFRLRSI